MKSNVVKITLWGKTVGYLYWDKSYWKNETSIFQFDNDFLLSGLDISPLKLSIKSPRVKAGVDIRGGSPKDVFKGLPPVFADSLPDHWGNTLFRAWAIEQGIRMKNTSPVDMLSFIGRRGMGALEYLPAMIEGDDRPFDVDVTKLYEFAKSILEEREQPAFSADRELLWQDLIKLGTSPGGKRPKALIAINEKENIIKSGQAILPPGYVYYILKYDNEKDSFPYARMEYAYYQMAKDSQINMHHSELRRFEKATHFLTKRFDRENGEKIHMQSLLAMNGETDSYEEAFHVIDVLGLNYSDKEQLFRRMVFNVVSGNIDDHARNFSFLMDKSGKWSLSPAYDMVYSIDPATLYSQKGQFLSINRKKQRITQKDLLAIGRYNNINAPERIIEQTLDVVGKMESYVRPLGVSEKTFKMMAAELNDKYKELEKEKNFLLNPSGYSLSIPERLERAVNEEKIEGTTPYENRKEWIRRYSLLYPEKVTPIIPIHESLGAYLIPIKALFELAEKGKVVLRDTYINPNGRKNDPDNEPLIKANIGIQKKDNDFICFDPWDNNKVLGTIHEIYKRSETFDRKRFAIERNGIRKSSSEESNGQTLK